MNSFFSRFLSKKKEPERKPHFGGHLQLCAPSGEKVSIGLDASNIASKAQTIAWRDSRLSFDLASASGYLVQFGNNTRFTEPPNTPACSFEADGVIKLAISTSGCVLGDGCTLFLLLYSDGILNKKLSYSLRSDSVQSITLPSVPTEAAFAIRLAGSGTYSEMLVNIEYVDRKAGPQEKASGKKVAVSEKKVTAFDKKAAVGRKSRLSQKLLDVRNINLMVAEARVVCQRQFGEKPLLLSVAFFDAGGAEIPPPYEGFSFSSELRKQYRYIKVPKQAERELTFCEPISPVSEASYMSLELYSWDTVSALGEDLSITRVELSQGFAASDLKRWPVDFLKWMERKFAQQGDLRRVLEISAAIWQRTRSVNDFNRLRHARARQRVLDTNWMPRIFTSPDHQTDPLSICHLFKVVYPDESSGGAVRGWETVRAQASAGLRPVVCMSIQNEPIRNLREDDDSVDEDDDAAVGDDASVNDGVNARDRVKAVDGGGTDNRVTADDHVVAKGHGDSDDRAAANDGEGADDRLAADDRVTKNDGATADGRVNPDDRATAVDRADAVDRGDVDGRVAAAEGVTTDDVVGADDNIDLREGFVEIERDGVAMCYLHLPGMKRNEIGQDTLLEVETYWHLRAAEKNRCSIVHASSGFHGFDNALKGLAVARGLQIPFVYEVRSFHEHTWGPPSPEILNAPLTQARMRQEERCMLAADAVVTISEAMVGQLRLRGVPKEKIFLVPNAVDARFLTAPNEAKKRRLRRRFGLVGKKVIGSVSNLSKREGHEVLLRAFERLVRTHQDLVCLIVGAGSERQRLEILAIELGIGDQVIFAGSIDHKDILEVYSIIDVFVVPRIPDYAADYVTPLKPFEALAVGCKLIMSDLPVSREIVGDEERGLLFNVGSEDDLASKTEAVLVGGGPLEEMSQRAKTWIHQNRTFARNAALLETAYAFARTQHSAKMRMRNLQSAEA